MLQFIFFYLLSITVPVDVFSQNSEWSGFYEYLGKRQATTFTVTGFNASSGRVNVTLLETSGVSIRLSGKTRKTLILFRVTLISFALKDPSLYHFHFSDLETRIHKTNPVNQFLVSFIFLDLIFISKAYLDC